ncbi:hypothetical protein L6452_16457 [Arctium lappa]|uniref:Uncharacterized protein n=1 Tax=Arctium lappa TaxID=4217 RepID=A0ACB9C0Q2_ARCLA|nr:hypothetical protein L6452_16457 [Arctium lappa]
MVSLHLHRHYIVTLHLHRQPLTVTLHLHRNLPEFIDKIDLGLLRAMRLVHLDDTLYPVSAGLAAGVLKNIKGIMSNLFA